MGPGAGYVAAQVAGALLGVAVAHLMFDEPLYAASRHARHGAGQLLGECVATFGLLAVIRSCAVTRPPVVPYAVGAYIAAAYWFTSSTSFANPAVTLARALSDTFTGIRPADVPGFILAQIAGAAATTVLIRGLLAAPAAGVRDSRAPGAPATRPAGPAEPGPARRPPGRLGTRGG